MRENHVVDDVRRAMLERTAGVIAGYRDRLQRHRVGAASTRAEVVARLDAPLPAHPAALDVVFDELVAAAEPGLTAVAGRGTSGSSSAGRSTPRCWRIC